jgi:hypothetical protein
VSARTWVLLLTVAATVAGAGVAFGRGAADPPGFDHAHAALAPADARAFDRFALYSVGDSFENLPLHAITRRDDAPHPAERVRADYVGFVYGDCVASDEQGCPPPLEIQVWPACERSIADYSLTPTGDPLPHESTFVRGAPAAWFEDGLRLEVYSGDVTVVVFGVDHAQIGRAAAALRAVNAAASQARMLPPPARGALAGTLACSSS